MSNDPLDADDGRFYVLLNDAGQHSLWPSFAEVPVGWRIVFGEESRLLCLEHVEANWTDLRPKSMREAVTGDRASVAAT
ncbi:MbtH family protein [Streptomyces sp. NPDC048257]|uniref:MbtH family protein n=1 Tax=Streptomyces sp. NPDC048257 TaxID=3365526 RepID=UPI003721B938